MTTSPGDGAGRDGDLDLWRVAAAEHPGTDSAAVHARARRYRELLHADECPGSRGERVLHDACRVTRRTPDAITIVVE